ncbi:hypothetical protein [Legionella qingyii]|uniref:Uncharacterized protein n=1 Tax=Legionella qingyii TaxID=2184757 RepID=A0ABY0CGQ6_9GAMM|nr:hypothetical protein [Legionella qingyii]RUR22073.1 hypothetical protein ELY20_10960 [Legionella qingyii]RUR25653.1 hypothetical protein ELY16_09770 [Legionella qingyii]
MGHPVLKTIGQRILRLEEPFKNPQRDQVFSELQALKMKPNYLKFQLKVDRFERELQTLIAEAYSSVNIDEFNSLAQFSRKAIGVMDKVLTTNPSQKNPGKKEFDEIKGLFDELKQETPDNTFGRICCGILTALLIPILFVFETLLLPGFRCYEPYQGTKSCADLTYRLFHSKAHPLIESIEDIIEKYQIITGDLDPTNTVRQVVG